MADLFEKLATLGLSASYVRRAGLPSWWDDELNDIPAGVLEGAMHIAQRLHVNLVSLLKDDLEAQFEPLLPTKFKYHHQQAADVPLIAHQVASGIAELVAYSTRQHPFIPLPKTAVQVRRGVLEQGTKVDLESLLHYCWHHGVAVVYFNDYPQDARKLTGMIQWQEGRPVILLSSARTQSAWLAFHLAHELGHLVLGHVQEGILVDDEISQSSEDVEEMAANEFAVKLLVNRLDNCFSESCFRNSNQLRKQILKKVEADPTVDSCVLAFNYSWHSKNFGLANKAVEKLDCAEGGNQVIGQFLEKRVDWEDLNSDSIYHLDYILGADV